MLKTFIEFNNVAVLHRYDLFFLGVNFVIGSAININFEAGYWMMLFNILVTGCGYLLLASSLAEITSALPFSGGIYGIVRAFVHPFVGFYVACFELVINIFYIALSVHSLANLPIQSEHFPERFFLLNCFFVYVITVSICLIGGKVFWGLNMAIGITCLVIILIYILGSIPHAEFSAWKHNDEPFNAPLLMSYIPPTSLCFLGIQYLPLNSKLVSDSQKNVPISMMETIAVIIPILVAVITVASSISPGHVLLALEDHPLIFGFSKIFGTSLPSSHFFGLPGLLSTCFSFIYCFGRQASTMAGSGLLPPAFQWTLPGFGTPYVPLITVAICSFIIDIFAYIWDHKAEPFFIDVCALSSYIVFIAFFIAYIRFLDNYSSIQRSYSSPFGKIGAIIGILIFSFAMVAVLGFQEEGYYTVIFLAGLSILIFLAFKYILKGNHQFSEEEKNELFKAYLITANRMTKSRLKKKNQASNASQSKGSASAGNNSRGLSSRSAGSLSASAGPLAASTEIKSSFISQDIIAPVADNDDISPDKETEDHERSEIQEQTLESRPPELIEGVSSEIQARNSIWSVHLVNNKVQPLE